MESIIRIVLLSLLLGFVGNSLPLKKIYKSIKRETILKIQKGLPSLEVYARKLTENS